MLVLSALAAGRAPQPKREADRLGNQSGYLPPKGGMREKPTLTLLELDRLLRIFLVDVYHRRTHTETKTSPSQRWETDGFLPRMPDSLERLLTQIAYHRDQ
jgi:hypothetical protein